MIWKEGTNIRLKDFHIDVVVFNGTRIAPWRATSFYGQLN